MIDILKVLEYYENLHGILILMKSNESRLELKFRYCIMELLMYFHRNAVENIVFGFTHTRIANYTSGDSLIPLRTLLEKFRGDVDIGLTKDNIYCFDSESFRYLAVYKQNVPFGHYKENHESWKHSFEECERLLRHL